MQMLLHHGKEALKITLETLRKKLNISDIKESINRKNRGENLTIIQKMYVMRDKLLASIVGIFILLFLFILALVIQY